MSGELIIEDLIVGDGAEAEKNSIVTVNYTGLLTDGTKFIARDDSDAKLYRQKVGDVKWGQLYRIQKMIWERFTML